MFWSYQTIINGNSYILPRIKFLSSIVVKLCVTLNLCCDFASLAVGSRFCWCWLTWEQWSLFYSTFSSHRWVQHTRRPSESLVWSMMSIVYCCSLVWRDFLFWYVIVTEWTAFNKFVHARLVATTFFFFGCPFEPFRARVLDSEY